MISTADPGTGHLPPPAEVPGSCPQRRGGAPARARRLFPLGPVNHAVIFNLGEAGLGELIVQPVVPAVVAGHVDFQGVESFPVLLERCLRAGTGVWRRISP